MGQMKASEYPPVLDACCGGRMFWFDKENPLALFQDIRDADMTLCDGRPFAIHPDVVADFRSMPYPDETFSMVVFDPPHLLRSVTGSKLDDLYGSPYPKFEPKGWQQLKYGAIGNGDWRDTLRDGFRECFRVLKPGGFLIFKWSDIDIPVSKVLELTPAKPLFGHISGKRANTHWICFMKKTNNNQAL